MKISTSAACSALAGMILLATPAAIQAQSSRCVSATRSAQVKYAEWQRLSRRYCPAKGGCYNRTVLDSLAVYLKALQYRDRACGR